MPSPKHKNGKPKNIKVLKKVIFQTATVTDSVLDLLYFRGKVGDLLPFLFDGGRPQLPSELLKSPMELGDGVLVINLYTN